MLSLNYQMNKLIVFFVYFIFSITFVGRVSGQEKEKYILGGEQKLKMVVHIWGAVKSPGEYQVSDDTNVLELISKAGGPTEFSKLSSVRLTRIEPQLYFKNNGSYNEKNGSNNSKFRVGKRIIKINIDNYLKKENASSPPVLQPGDVIYIPRNNWFRWRNVVAVARDLSVIASVYFIYLRATR